MNPSQLIELMHTVLDGEATATQTRGLELQLSSDASARAPFDALRHLFEGLSRVPMAFPPGALVASVLA